MRKKLTYEEITDRFFREFNEFPFSGAGSAGNLNIHASLATDNYCYEKTPYFYKGEKKFVHFTKAEYLHSILEEQAIRFYNLFNSKDKNECLRASKELYLISGVDYNKANFYSFSFCELADLRNPFIWNRYGDKYGGIGIQFGFQNNPLIWERFHLSNVYYKKPKHFNKLHHFLSEIRESGYIVDHLDIGIVLGFHKDHRFHNENEVRLASFIPFPDYGHFEKYVIETWKVDRSVNKPVPISYIRVPLWIDKTYWDFNLIPKPPEFPGFGGTRLKIPEIKIEKIFIGNKFCSESTIDEYKSFLRNKIYKKLGYGVDVEICGE